MEALAHALKMKFGLSPDEPDVQQLKNIVADVLAVKAAGKVPTSEDWRTAVQRHCPSIGKWKYAGEDNSNLNALLAQMQAQAQVARK